MSLRQLKKFKNENIVESKRNVSIVPMTNASMPEGKFVPDNPMIHVATVHVQCTAAADLGWWENRISSRLCQPIKGKL